MGSVPLDAMSPSAQQLLPGESWGERVSSSAFLCYLCISLLSLEREGKYRPATAGSSSANYFCIELLQMSNFITVNASWY